MRVKIFKGIVLFSFLFLVLGLFYTQILKGSLYSELSENNRIRVLLLEAPRGKIYDRNGRAIVNNRLSFDVQVIFREMNDAGKAARLISDITGIDEEVLFRRIEAAGKMPFVAVKIAENVEKDKAIRIEESGRDLPGVIVTTRPLRNYVYKDAFSHVTGYLGKISGVELRKYRTYGYHIQDFVGKDGLERTFNDYLRGTDGGLQIEVDSKGRQLRRLAVKEPCKGKDIYLNIDLELQEFCYSLMADKSGAIIAMDPSSGAILALVSLPAFNPNIFVVSGNSTEISAILNNKSAFPFLNRAISGTYPLGSVFKIVVAAASLDSGKVDEKKTFSCNGSLRVGNRAFRCWKEKGHGTQNITEALKNSCNVFFYQLALLTGVDEISKYAFKLGLGRPTGIDLLGEARGLVPTPEWKKRKLKKPWFKGETANYAIGQGYLLVTPIQVARMMCAVANGGELVEPVVCERIEDVKLRRPRVQDTGLGEGTLRGLKEGLRNVVNEPHGTGLYARSEKIIISGKTGTAQNSSGKSHAWFTGFAPFKNPKISVVVFIEHGGKGGLNPARFAKKIIEKAKELELL